MSRIYFHTENEGDAEVLGAERARMKLLCTDLASALIPHGLLEHADRYMTADARRELLAIVPAERTRIAALYLRQSDTPVFQVCGEPVDNFDLMLNTVLAIGNNPMCLFARLHGQVELHAYVEGPHRSWLAGVIREGLEIGLCRAGVGWDGVVELLEQADDAPVVTSCTQADSFPDYEQTWEESITALRADRGVPALEPATLRTLFGNGKTMLDVADQRPAEVAPCPS